MADPSPAAPPARPLRVLVVDDHADSVEMLARVLELKGHDVTSVTSAADALRLCGERAFDLLISDLGMPDCDGWDLLARVRAICGVRSIALSGFARAADVDKSQAAGFDAHLAKPVNFTALLATIDDVMAKG